MRILAYGGTEYAERRRIGDWSAIPIAPLGDWYGLSGDNLGLGCGVIDNLPVLIIRQIQKKQNRRYAYSLLLDPGADLWERFEWNAASLALALFGDDPGQLQDSLGNELLSNPEDFTQEKLQSLLINLLPPATTNNLFTPYKLEQTAATEPPNLSLAENDFLSLIVGAATLKEPVAISPQSIGFEALPSIQQMAKLLTQIAPCFRVGLGWLIGGSEIHGRALNAQLVLDDRLTEETLIARDIIAKGQSIRAAWEALSPVKLVENKIKELSEVPIQYWGDAWTRSLDKAFDRVVLFTEILRPTEPIDDILEKVDANTQEELPFQHEFRLIAHDLALGGRDPIDKAATGFLLRDHFDWSIPLDDREKSRLNADVVAEFYAEPERRILPMSDADRLKVSPPVRTYIWRKLIETEREADSIHRLLFAAIRDLWDKRSVPEESLKALAVIAVEQTAAANGLTVWQNDLTNSLLTPFISESIKTLAITRAVEGADPWLEDYLHLAGDAGGIQLANRLVSDAEMQRIFLAIKEAANKPISLSAKAEKWLINLAYSPLRQRLPLGNKVNLLKMNLDSWEPLRTIRQMYRGEDERIRFQVPLDELERASLLQELLETIDEGLAPKAAPNLLGLINFFGKLPEDVVLLLEKQRPSLAYGKVKNWLDGWEKLVDHQEFFQNELVRYALEARELADKQGILYRIVSQLSDRKLHDLCYRLLCEDKEEQPEKRRDQDHLSVDRLKALIPGAVAEKNNENLYRIKLAVAAAFDRVIEDVNHRNTFLRRFGVEREALEQIFYCLPDTRHHSLVGLLVLHDRKFMLEHAVNIYGAAAKGLFNEDPDNGAVKLDIENRQGGSKFNSTAIQKAVLYYLVSDEGKDFSKAVAKEKRLAVEELKGRLRQILQSSGLEDEVRRAHQKVRDDSAAASQEGETHSRALTAGWKSFLNIFSSSKKR